MEFAFPPVMALALPFLASASSIWPLRVLLPPGLRPSEPPSRRRSSQACVSLRGHRGETPVSNPGLGDSGSTLVHLAPASWNPKAAETPLGI